MESYKFQFHIFSIVIILVQSKVLSEFYLDFHHEKLVFEGSIVHLELQVFLLILSLPPLYFVILTLFLLVYPNDYLWYYVLVIKSIVEFSHYETPQFHHFVFEKMLKMHSNLLIIIFNYY